MRVCICGGGPAGVMLGYLLARSGIDVTVLEKHADFFRDFRGDTIHPSTMQVMDELGLLDGLLRIPHSEIRELSGHFGSRTLRIAQFDRVPGRCKFIAFMPQWDFLNFLSGSARRYPNFKLRMETEATDLLRQDAKVTGVRAKTPQAEFELPADVTFACDGRHSILRERAGLMVQDIGAPMDALWMRMSKPPNAPSQDFGNVVPGGILVAIDRRDYYQCAFVIRKGGFSDLQAQGLQAFRDQIARIAPFLAPSVHEIQSWDDVKLLTVTVNRLVQWHLPGLLCLGDAAHAMSPVGGVGINLAIQDAVAAANILTEPLRRGDVSQSDLHAVQQRREWPAKATQALQVVIQNQVINRFLSARDPVEPPRFFDLLNRSEWLRRFLAYAVGVGFRPEHVHQNPSTSA